MGGEAKGKMFEFSLMKQIKGNYSLLPIVFAVGVGCTLCAFHITRLLVKSPDIHLNKNKNPRPWEYLETPEGKAVQYKYYSNLDYSKMQSERPKLD